MKILPWFRTTLNLHHLPQKTKISSSSVTNFFLTFFEMITLGEEPLLETCYTSINSGIEYDSSAVLNC